jgi:hypothetical protein
MLPLSVALGAILSALRRELRHTFKGDGLKKLITS